MSYSPQLRTGLLLSGNGTGGAYHAGVLRALHEAGVKIDVVGGRGIGTVGALFAAIDASQKTWEAGGVWHARVPVRMYEWRQSLKWAARLALLAVAALAIPLLVLATGLIAYPLSFLAQMIYVDAGYRIANAYSEAIRYFFAPGVLPTIVPRLVTLFLTAAVVVLAVSALRTRYFNGSPHRRSGRWWARLIGSPWTPEPGIAHVRTALWQFFQGSIGSKEPAPSDLSRRYSELLIENLGQPGFRELILTTLDLETRGELVFAALREDRRAEYFRRNRGDLVDLSGVGRSQVMDALAAALSVPVLTPPHVISFSPESYWKGESHRISDRVGAVARLMEEMEAAGVEQVIVVCADAERAAPHRLVRPADSLETRLAEQYAALETAGLRDAFAAHASRFGGLFIIQPGYNPIGPFDYAGVYDDRSDRHLPLTELIDRGYEDAYKQFVEPIVGGGE